MMSPEVEALASKLEAMFSDGHGAAASDDAAMKAVVASVFPALAASDQAGKAGPDNDRAATANAVRATSQRLTRRALQAGAAPLQWVPAGAAGPVLPVYLERAFALCQTGYCPPFSAVSVTMGLLEDIADAAGGDGCGDVLAWLTAHEAMLRTSKDSKMPILKLCNRLLARLSRASEPGLCAEVLVFVAKVFPLSERSGLNLTNAVSPALISAAEEVPPGAVDSSGQPVDALLYTTTWGLQPLLHNPREAAVPENWAKFLGDVRTVLGALSTQPAQVAAGGAGSAAAPATGGEGTVGYLSSPQLFGLQLRDAAFRRALLVQVLVLLQATQAPVKQADPSLRAKQVSEAHALEEEVYVALEATPDNGKAFAAAVRNVLKREEGWVQWKKGGPPPITPPGDGKPCPPYARPPLAPGLAERVANGEATAKAEAAKAQARREALLAALAREKRSPLEMDADELMAPRKRIKTDSEVLRGVSRLDNWVHHVPDSNMEGLTVHERPAFPTLELLARPALDQMDPDACVEEAYRIARTDPVYRWRLARLMARRWPGSQAVNPLPPWMPASIKDPLTSADPAEVEYVMARILQDKVAPAWVEQQTEARKAEAAEKATAAAKGDATPTTTGGAGAAAAGTAGAAGDGKGSAAAAAVSNADGGQAAAGNEAATQEAGADGEDATAAGGQQAGGAGEGEEAAAEAGGGDADMGDAEQEGGAAVAAPADEDKAAAEEEGEEGEAAGAAEGEDNGGAEAGEVAEEGEA